MIKLHKHVSKDTSWIHQKSWENKYFLYLLKSGLINILKFCLRDYWIVKMLSKERRMMHTGTEQAIIGG